VNALQEKDSQTVYGSWAQAMAGVLSWPLQLLETQCEVGLEIVEAALRIPGAPQADPAEPAGAAAASDEFHRLEALALERARRGLALPRELYQVPYRDRVDWSRLPGWARPIDPEVFQGCGHEG
jgi:hypothetical protein